MPEQEREQFYWRISLLFTVVSPWILYYLSKTSPNPFVGLSHFKQVVTIGMVVSMAIVMLLEMLYSRLFKGKTSFKFWLVNPAVECRNRTLGSIKGCTQAIEQKLNRLGFQTTISQPGKTDRDGQVLEFEKAAKKPIHHFLDHAFSGKVTLSPGFNGVDIHAQLTFNDTIIVETGEMNKLQAISEFITLKAPEISMKGVPFTLYCGLIFAYATTITGFVISMNWITNYAVFNSLALSGTGSILLSLFFSFKNGKDFMGWRLVFSGLYLATLPYFAWILSTVC